MVQIRPLHPDDWPTLRAMRLALLADAPRSFGSTYEAEAQLGDAQWAAKARQWNDGERALTLLAWDGPTCCGIGGAFVDAEDATVGHVVSMWVAPTHRRQGIAARLMAELEAWARDRRFARLTLHVTDGNGPAETLYRRLGFAPTGHRHEHARHPGVVVSEMSKQLAPPPV